jgi:hypothetical protein
MRLTSGTAGARPSPYDRNQVPKTSVYHANGVAPHASTQRWTYTVPVGKKAQFDVVLARGWRSAVAAPVGQVEVSIGDIPSGGVNGYMLMQDTNANAVGQLFNVSLTQLGAMGVGDQIQALTIDTSTGGTVDYVVDAKYTEYDA